MDTQITQILPCGNHTNHNQKEQGFLANKSSSNWDGCLRLSGSCWEPWNLHRRETSENDVDDDDKNFLKIDYLSEHLDLKTIWEENTKNSYTAWAQCHLLLTS